MKTVVKMFQPRFSGLVESGAKRQTVRPIPKRGMPEVGDWLNCRVWTGKPYRSPQRTILTGTIKQVFHVRFIGGEVEQLANDGSAAYILKADEFAARDGFSSASEMFDWFQQTHGLPFVGICIRW